MSNQPDCSDTPFVGQLEPPPSPCPVTGFLTEPTRDGPEQMRLVTIDALDNEQAITELLMLVAQLRCDPDPLQTVQGDLSPQPQETTRPLAATIRVALMEEDSLVREGIRSQLNREDDLQLVGETYTGKGLFPLLNKTQPDVLIFGAHVPHSQRNPAIPLRVVETLEKMGRRYPNVAVILLARHYFPLAEETLEKVRGYILRHDFRALNMAAAIRTVYQGGQFFSETARHEMLYPVERGRRYKLDGVQVAVLSLLASAPEADGGLHAQALGMSYNAYQAHVQRALRALRVTNRLAAVVRATQMGILRLEEL